MNQTPPAASTPYAKGVRQGLKLEYITLSWNVIGMAIVLWAAISAHSVALAGFGLDSLIEILASAIVVWQLTGVGERREAKALHVIAIAFALLVIYILLQVAHTLLTRSHPQTSTIGMVWLALTFIVMLSLAYGKRQVGRKIQNPVLITEGKVTLVDAYLAGAVLIGITLNALLGWWWADPLAGLVIVYYGVKESWHGWHEARELQG